MNLRMILIPCAVIALGGPAGTAAAPPPAREAADRKFEGLLAAARADPGKADWKALRRAFSETSHYDPYGVEVEDRLREIAMAIGRGEFKPSEAALLKLADREGSMRIDTLAMLMMLYERTDQPEKAATYRKLVGGILGVLEAPKAGARFEDAIEVLFIAEEYLVAHNLPIESQSLVVREGHRFDVLAIKADGERPARNLYFNVDLLRNAANPPFGKD